MMKKAYKLTFQNGKNRLVEDDAPLEHLRAVCLNRYLSDGSGELSLCKAVEEVLDQQMALRVLDEMDALRRKQWYHCLLYTSPASPGVKNREAASGGLPDCLLIQIPPKTSRKGP